MKDKRIIIGAVVGIIALVGGVYGFMVLTQPKQQTVVSASGQVLTVPTRSAEINGTVLRIEGNEMTVQRVISTLTAEEQAAKKAKMQSLTPEERQALRGQESEVAQTEDVVVIIPVGVPVVVGTGDMTGTITESSLSEIKVGSGLSIWKNGDTIEMVKIKGL
jgi:hypothetical protein